MAAAAHFKPPLRFGVFELDEDTGELRKAGRTVRLRPQAAKVLRRLASSPGRLITRDELRDEIWGQETFVDFEHGLNLCIRQVRTALGDDADTPRYVETLPKRGYRFIAPVEIAGQTTSAPAVTEPAFVAPRPQRRRVLVWSASLAVALLSIVFWGWARFRPAANPAGRVVLAVLPLENLSGKQEQDYISDGLTEELITQLSRLEPDHLAVIARTSSMQYKGTKKKVDEIGRELRVDYVLEGGMRHEGDRIRVSAQLIRVRDQTHLWAQTYERHLRDILELQSDIAHAVADEIQLQLTPQRRTQLASSRALDPDVYVAYLRGRYFWNQRGTEGLRKAIAHFELAVQKDRAFAPAYVGLADCYNLLSMNDVAPPDEAFPKAREAALKALALDDTLGAAHTSLGYTRFRFDWAWDEAEREFRRAIALDPGYATAHHWYGEFLAALGRFEEGLAELHRAVELDPLSLIINADLGWFLDNAGLSDRALQQLRRTIDLEPNFAPAHLYLGQVYERKGLYAQATAAYQRSADLSRSRSRPAALGHLYAISGNRAEATKIIDELLQQPHPSPVAIAIVYTGLGDLDRAFEWLERGYRERSDWLIYLPSYPFYDPLRGDPRFKDLLRRMKLPESNNHG